MFQDMQEVRKEQKVLYASILLVIDNTWPLNLTSYFQIVQPSSHVKSFERRLLNSTINITSLPLEIFDLDDFFPNSTVLIHFPGDLPIARDQHLQQKKVNPNFSKCLITITNIKKNPEI